MHRDYGRVCFSKEAFNYVVPANATLVPTQTKITWQRLSASLLLDTANNI